MITRKARKHNKRKCQSADDVPVSTSLPPKVKSSLNGFLLCNVQTFYWLGADDDRPLSVKVNLKWWGEDGDGTQFQLPLAPTKGKPKQTMARYAIRASVAQFSKYLSDMEELFFIILDGKSNELIGQCVVKEISILTQSNPILGQFPVFSGDGKKVADLKLSLSIKSLIQLDDTGSSYSSDAYGSSVKGRDSSTEKNPVYMIPEPNHNPAKTRYPVSLPSIQDQALEQLVSKTKEIGKKLEQLESTIDIPPQQHPEKKKASFLNSRTTDIESRTVEWLFNEENDLIIPNTSVFSPPSSCSEHSIVDDLDPEIISDLFYDAHKESGALDVDFVKEPIHTVELKMDDDGLRSEHRRVSLSSLEDPGNIRPPSRQSSSSSISSSKKKTSQTGLSHSSTAGFESVNSLLNLSVNRLTTLGKVSIARVFVGTLEFTQKFQEASTSKYFIEYKLPFAVKRPHVEDTSRIVSRNMTSSGKITFDRRAIFETDLNEDSIKLSLNGALSFGIFSKVAGQRMSSRCGFASFPLKKLLLSKDLRVDERLHVFEADRSGRQTDKIIGELNISVELNSDNPNFAEVVSHLKDGKNSLPSPNSVQFRTKKTLSSPSGGVNRLKGKKDFLSSTSGEMARLKNKHDGLLPTTSSELSSKPPIPEKAMESTTTQTDSSQTFRISTMQRESPAAVTNCNGSGGITVYAFLCIPDGKSFGCTFDLRTGCVDAKFTDNPELANYYVTCGAFWMKEKLSSTVCWQCSEPKFGFHKITPLVLDSHSIKQMANNFLVVEVWNKLTGTEDELVGIVKLPLHQFYQSFKDSNVQHMLLSAKYPIVGVDNYLPVLNLYSGCHRGEIHTLLAIGSLQQISNLQQIRPEFETPNEELIGLSSAQNAGKTVKHNFEISVDRVHGFISMGDAVWAESDCFVQYRFPSQFESANELKLKSFRTDLSLSLPEIAFNDTKSFAFCLPGRNPIQHEFMQLFEDGLPFDLWSRFYHPNTRDQLVARTCLPISKLNALVTMQTDGHNVQSFPLSLLPVEKQKLTRNSRLETIGVLDVTVCYQTSTEVVESVWNTKIKRFCSSSVRLKVTIPKACGLEYAMAMNPEIFKKEGKQFFAVVELPFLSGTSRYYETTSVVSGYSPDFEEHFIFDCPLALEQNGGLSLADLLLEHDIVFKIFASDDGSSTRPNRKSATTVGTSRIPLRRLLTRKTGIHGWYPVNSSYGNEVMSQFVGGLHVSVGFVEETAHDQVIKAGHELGTDLEMLSCEKWSEPLRFELDIDQIYMRSEQLSPDLQCIVRFGLFDRPVYSSPVSQLLFRSGSYRVDMPCNFEAGFQPSESFLWYITEQQLEVQVWITDSFDEEYYFGSAFIDLDRLLKERQFKGTYPLLKSGAPNMKGSYLNINVSCFPTSHRSPRKKDMDGFPVTVFIEKALHLPLVSNTLSELKLPPNCYVTFVSAKNQETVSTAVEFNSCDPEWNFTVDVRLNPDVLVKPDKQFLVKIWHRDADSDLRKGDKVIGVVAIDLKPLLSGLQQICGWYNIVDLTNHCQGQLKCAIVPNEPVRNFFKRPEFGDGDAPSTPFVKTNYSANAASTGFSHFVDHYEGVKNHHESQKGEVELNELARRHLRQNMEELAKLTATLKSKLGENTNANVPEVNSNFNLAETETIVPEPDAVEAPESTTSPEERSKKTSTQSSAMSKETKSSTGEITTTLASGSHFWSTETNSSAKSTDPTYCGESPHCSRVVVTEENTSDIESSTGTRQKNTCVTSTSRSSATSRTSGTTELATTYKIPPVLASSTAGSDARTKATSTKTSLSDDGKPLDVSATSTLSSVPTFAEQFLAGTSKPAANDVSSSIMPSEERVTVSVPPRPPDPSSDSIDVDKFGLNNNGIGECSVQDGSQSDSVEFFDRRMLLPADSSLEEENDSWFAPVLPHSNAQPISTERLTATGSPTGNGLSRRRSDDGSVPLSVGRLTNVVSPNTKSSVYSNGLSVEPAARATDRSSERLTSSLSPAATDRTGVRETGVLADWISSERFAASPPKQQPTRPGNTSDQALSDKYSTEVLTGGSNRDLTDIQSPVRDKVESLSGGADAEIHNKTKTSEERLTFSPSEQSHQHEKESFSAKKLAGTMKLSKKFDTKKSAVPQEVVSAPILKTREADVARRTNTKKVSQFVSSMLELTSTPLKENSSLSQKDSLSPISKNSSPLVIPCPHCKPASVVKPCTRCQPVRMTPSAHNGKNQPQDQGCDTSQNAAPSLENILKRNGHRSHPSYFPSTETMAQSMKVLQMITGKPSPSALESLPHSETPYEQIKRTLSQNRAAAAPPKLSPPTAEQTKRIAKIFAHKFA